MGRWEGGVVRAVNILGPRFVLHARYIMLIIIIIITTIMAVVGAQLGSTRVSFRFVSFRFVPFKKY